MAIETPHYDIFKKDGAFEIRKYSGYITANVKIQSRSYSEAVNTGFSYLADYIFGNNRRSNKISMTVPVSAEKLDSERIAMTAPVNAKLEGDTYLVSFTMPKKYKIIDLPIPNNKEVFITEVRPYWAVVKSFSGYITDNKYGDYLRELEDWAAANNIEIIGKPVSSQFDPPWKPWFLRHNEVYMEIRKPNK